MPWVRIDDDLPSHRKFIGLSERAFVMWISGLCFAGRQLTDGRISRAALAHVRPGFAMDELEQVAAELVRAELWEASDEGWLIHDYLDYQPSRAHVQAERNAQRERMRRVRERRSQEHPPARTAARSDAQRANVRRTKVDGAGTPSSPIPSQENPERFSLRRTAPGRIPEVVEIYVQERRALGSEPVESDKKRVGAQVKELFAAGKAPELVHAATREAARRNQPGLIVRVAGDIEAGNNGRKPPRALAQAGGRFDDGEYM